MLRLLTALLTISLGASSVFAADKVVAAPEEQDRFTIATATCGDVFTLYEPQGPMRHHLMSSVSGSITNTRFGTR